MIQTLANRRSLLIADTSEFYMSEILGRRIYDNYGHVVGKVKDLVAVWLDGSPRIVGIKFAHHTDIIPVGLVAEFGIHGVFLHERPRISMVRHIAPEEIFVNRWLLDKQIIDIRGAKVVRVNDIKLRWEIVDGELAIHLISVDVGPRGLFRRLGMNFLANKFQENLLDWQNFNPLQDRYASLQLLFSNEGLDKLHPADLADILEDLNQHGQNQLLRYLDPETAADTLAEVESETRSQLLESMETDQASTLVQAMAPDEAADVLGELSWQKRAEILQHMNPDEARDVQELLRYEEGSIGSLMTTEVVALPHTITAQEAIERLRLIAPPADSIYYIFITDAANRLLGVLSLRDLIVAAPDTALEDIMRKNVAAIHPEDDYEEVLDLTVKYNLLAVPVVNEDSNELLGMVTVDDVLDTLMEDRRKHLFKYSYLQSLRAFRS